MRDIKFRAWNSVEIREDFAIKSSGENTANPNWVIMQFTGLKDKNGKDIYEGDIIQECEIGDVIWDGDAVVTKCPIGVVIYNAPCFNVEQKVIGEAKFVKEEGGSQLNLSAYDGFYEWHMIDSYKVIGNIYENPELIESNGKHS